MDKLRIKNLLDKNDLSYREAGEIIRAVADMFHGYEQAAIRSIKDNVNDVELLVGFAKKVAASMEEQNALLADAYKKAEAQYSEIYDKYATARREFEKHIKDLGGSLPPVVLPYGLKEMLEMAERFQHVDDESWERFLDLARALRSREQA